METLPPTTTLGRVHLAVENMPRALDFYQKTIGLQLLDEDGEAAVLGTDRPILSLSEQPGARKARGTTGLYHFAILVPSRRDLAFAIRRVADGNAAIQGASDHGVSEALYLADPEGNGIEIYRDRPRDEWPRNPDGQLSMVTDPFDFDGVMAELDTVPDTGMAPATKLGHMHLHVSEIPKAEAFYRQAVGFDLVQRYGSSASFLSAGGYHHHLGINTWQGVGAPPPAPDMPGLRWFEILLPGEAELSMAADRLKSAGVMVTEVTDGLLVHDPSLNGIKLKVQ